MFLQVKNMIKINQWGLMGSTELMRFFNSKNTICLSENCIGKCFVKNKYKIICTKSKKN